MSEFRGKIIEKRSEKKITPVKKWGPLFESSKYKDIKDPCPVFDGTLYHIFGSGGDVRPEEWEILHATAKDIHGPWEEKENVTLIGMSVESVQRKKVAAPGVLYDMEKKIFHMFLQTDFTVSESAIEYLISSDGQTFTKANRALSSLLDVREIGLYDPHPFCMEEKKYLVYSATDPQEEVFRPRPDVHLAVSESDTWMGPWKRLGKILDHSEIADHHNRKDDPKYEWGIEGPQLAHLPNGTFLLNATCFLPSGKFGTRQRVFFAIAETCTGPYHTLGPVLYGQDPWESGENGHAAIITQNKKVYLFYQARSQEKESAWDNNWRYGIAEFNEEDLLF